MNEEVQTYLKLVKKHFSKSFINKNNELIFEPQNNIYFRLENVKTGLDFQCKALAWLSRPSCKGLNEHWQEQIRKGVNGLLNTHFTKEEMSVIYTYLGNDINRSLSIQFIQSNYDFAMFQSEEQ